MRLLLDQNLSHRLVRSLADAYPGTEHVRDVGLGSASDTAVWEFARRLGFTLVSKDSDFYQRSLLLGSPPKVIWIRVGNCTTEKVERLLRHQGEAITRFAEDATATFLIVSE